MDSAGGFPAGPPANDSAPRPDVGAGMGILVPVVRSVSGIVDPLHLGAELSQHHVAPQLEAGGELRRPPRSRSREGSRSAGSTRPGRPWCWPRRPPPGSRPAGPGRTSRRPGSSPCRAGPPRRVRLGVEGDQGRDVGPAVADDQALARPGGGPGPGPREDRGRRSCRPAVTRISCVRPVTRTKPSLVDLAEVARAQPPVGRSPPRSRRDRPSSRACTWGPRTSSSPSSLTRTVVPGSGRPTVPTLGRAGTFTVTAPVVSVRP